MEELLKEKADLEAKIIAKHKEVEAATVAGYWLKKRLKVIEGQIAATEKEAKTEAEALKEIAEGLEKQ